jgi:fluoride ion exporter CrcB/FEX
MPLQKYILIALGGPLGSLARFRVGSTIASRLGTRFLFGTFVINVTACVGVILRTVQAWVVLRAQESAFIDPLAARRP